MSKYALDAPPASNTKVGHAFHTLFTRMMQVSATLQAGPANVQPNVFDNRTSMKRTCHV